MKKLRFIDSLKFVRAIFIAVACVFAFMIAPAHADTTAIQSVIAYGKTEQNGTPTPTNPVPIMTNNGTLEYKWVGDGIKEGDGRWVQAYMNTSNNWSSATDVSASIRIPIQTNITYRLHWDSTGSSIYRVGFVKTDSLPDSSSVTLYKSNGTAGVQHRGNWSDGQNLVFTVTDTSIKYMVIQISGYSSMWSTGDLSRVWSMISKLHLQTMQLEINGATETITDSANHTATAQTLLSAGDIADEQNITTGAITRRVGVKVLDGTENWTKNSSLADERNAFAVRSVDFLQGSKVSYCTHFPNVSNTSLDGIYIGTGMNIILGASSSITTAAQFKAWLANQYAAGTPVIVVYPLAEPTTETVAAQTLTTAPVRQTNGTIMNMPIKTILTDGTEIMRGTINNLITIATTKYNEQQFAPVETRLDAAVAAVDTVVSQTMTQAQAIDTIATSKQTRPDEGCTAKYCLLVEDEDGTTHWYPIAGADEANPTNP